MIGKGLLFKALADFSAKFKKNYAKLFAPDDSPQPFILTLDLKAEVIHPLNRFEVLSFQRRYFESMESKMFKLDSKLLEVFYFIYKFKNVSIAAEHLGMSQPAVSNSLTKIRNHFNDPLFLRVGNEMLPTELAKQIFAPISEIIGKMELVNNFKVGFDPEHSNQLFTIAMTDVSHLVLLPKLTKYLKDCAPEIRFKVRSISRETSYQMANGEIDLAIGFLPELEQGFYQQQLFSQYYVVISRKDHPRLSSGTIDVESYMRESHVDVDTSVGHYLIENELIKKGLKRNVSMSLPSYLGVGLVVQETDMIATIPYYLSELLLSRGNLQILNAPLDFPTYPVRQFWHLSSHHQSSHQWLRQIIYGLFVDKD